MKGKLNTIQSLIGVLNSPIAQRKGVIISPEHCKIWVEELSKFMQESGRHLVSEPPIPNAPYINVIFCKGHNGWLPFTGYGCDISSKKTVDFINRINDAADVLNEKEG